MSGLLIGDARVSTDEQDLTAQRSALLALDIPRALWDGTDDDYFDGSDLDGRAILHRLDPIALLDRPPKR